MSISVHDRILSAEKKLTPREQRVATYVVQDYPYAGLDTIQNVADNAGVSLPSVTRFVTKIGFKGYNDFFKTLLAETKASHASPIQLQANAHLRSDPVTSGFFKKYMQGCITTMKNTTALISETQFLRICEKIQDPHRSIYIIGGRFSNSIAQILSLELRQIRDNVYHLPTDKEMWPEYILRMKKKDIFIVVDFRRHQETLYALTKKIYDMATPHIIAVTNAQNVPICRVSNEVVITPVDSDTAWDSYCATLALFQAIAYTIGVNNWDKTHKRMRQWDAYRVSE